MLKDTILCDCCEKPTDYSMGEVTIRSYNTVKEPKFLEVICIKDLCEDCSVAINNVIRKLKVR